MPTGGDGTAYMGEKMDLKKADMGDVITDFRKSDAPQFKGKSDKKIQKMAIAAKLEADEVKEALDKDDKPFIKHLVKKLRSGSKTHAKQADNLEKAVDENVMLTYKSGQGFDAKLGGKSVRNTVSNIKTGVDAVKNIKKEGGLVSGIKKTINDKKTTNTKTDVSTNVGDAIKNFKMKENTTIESELTIQDWNVDEIKYTEVEAVDIIKPEPLKPSPSNWISEIELDEGFKTRLVMKLGKKLLKNIGKVNPFTKTGAQRVTKSVRKYVPPDKITSQNIQTKSVVNQAKKFVDTSIKPNKGTKPVKVNLSKPIDFDKYLGKSQPIKKKFINKKPTGTFTDDLPPVKNSNPKKPIKDHYDWREDLGEDWQKVNRKDKTDGLSQKAVNAYRKENPGSKLKTAVTKDPKKLKKGSKSAKRRLSFCRRMKGMKKKLTSAKTSRDPDSRINKALRRWNC